MEKDSLKYGSGKKVYWKQGDRYGETIGDERQLASRLIIKVRFDNGEVRGVPETQLQIIEEIRDFSALFANRQFSDFRHFRQFFTHKRITGGLSNIVYSMKYGDVQFLPYQFKPVLKFIEADEQRLLIADDVGLGKTIESLYIWTELRVREGASRLLVVCPAMLRGKWQKDMQQHFGIKSDIVDSEELLNQCRLARESRNTPFVLITSLEAIRFKTIDDNGQEKERGNKKAELLNRFFEDVYDDSDSFQLFDLVIFDEAAKLTNPGTANFATARRINRIAKNLLLLSATPVSNSQADLFNLLRILSPNEYEHEEIFNEQFEQNRAIVKLAHCFYNPAHDLDETLEEANQLIEEVKGTSLFGEDPFFTKLQNNLAQRFSSDEQRRRTYDQLTDRFFYSNVFTRSRKRDVLDNVAVRSAQTADFELSEHESDIYRSCTKDLEEMSEENNGRIYVFGIMARQRELASSLPAAIRRWRDVAESHGPANEEDEFDDSDVSYESNYPKTALQLSEEDVRWLERNDGKYNKFVSVIKEKISEGLDESHNEKIVVFSFFRQTLRYLQKRLTEDGVSALMIMGGMSQKEKDDYLDKFKNDSSINVLLSSEVGAEGLDMQFSSLEFNYDLPWNPMRLEQRIGRIDRIGQEAKVIRIVNMFCSNTIEDRVLQKLYNKINIFRESIGELDEILGQQTQNIEIGLLSGELTEKQKEELADSMINKIAVDIQSIKNLEESAGLSKAYSDSIIEYVNRAEENNRYIRKEDVINYLYDFFTGDAHGSHFTKDLGNNDYWDLELSAVDRSSLQEFVNKSGKPFYGINNRKMKCTFPQGKKKAGNNYENIDVDHPIVKWISECTENKIKSSPVESCFTLKVPRASVNTRVFDKNAYVFFVGSFECTGLKKKKELMFFVCSPEDSDVKNQTDSENFIGQALFNGLPVTDFISRKAALNVDDSAINNALSLCKSSFESAMDLLTAEFEDDNEAAYRRMLAKTNRIYNDKLNRSEETIEGITASALSAAEELSFIIRKNCNLWITPDELMEKAGEYRRYLACKTDNERAKISLPENVKNNILKLSEDGKEKLRLLQQKMATVKGEKTKQENIRNNFEDALLKIENERSDFAPGFEDIGGGLIFID